jgi:hypothetical protein
MISSKAVEVLIISNLYHFIVVNTSASPYVPSNSADENIDLDVKFKNKTTYGKNKKDEFVNENSNVANESESNKQENAQNVNLDSKEEVKSIDFEDGTTQINEEKLNNEQEADKLDEAELLKEKEKLIYHIPLPEDNSNENVIVNSNKNQASVIQVSQTKIHQPDADKNIKNESMGVKLVIVNDDDEEQKVDLSDEESEEEDDD